MGGEIFSAGGGKEWMESSSRGRQFLRALCVADLKSQKQEVYREVLEVGLRDVRIWRGCIHIPYLVSLPMPRGDSVT